MAKTPEYAMAQLSELTDLVFQGRKIVSVERLGGMTNFTFKVKLDNGKNYIYRLPGEGTEEMIDRMDEKASTELGCSLGIDAELFYFDGKTGKKVMQYLENCDTLTAEQLRERRNIEDAADIFYRLHTSGADTKVPFEVFDMAAMYEKVINDGGVALYEDYPEVKAQVMKVKAEVDRIGTERVPCHNDSLCGNWVRTPERLYLIDWEYAGMNDPYWDLADLSIEAEYTPVEDEILLKKYHGGQPTREQRLKFVANKIYLDYLWSLWGLTRVPYDKEFMEKYAWDRYVRLKENLKTVNCSFNVQIQSYA